MSQIEAYPQARPKPALRRRRTAAGLDPQVAIVVPVYRHSALLVDAVSAALQQETSFEFCVILVNDGCPFEETHQACLEFLLGSSGRVFYLRRPNGGLSAARNTGIDFAVNTWLSVKAIYFLDADNIILPGSLQRAFDALEEDPGIGWIYPNIDMFGQEWTADFAGEYSVLQHLEHNICEAGSLVSRAVFDAGVRFDETMRLGFEDWDFWLSAVELGFRGKFLRDFGFRYRKRPESMVRDSERDRSEIQAYLRRKHAALWTQKNLLALEHAEAPRYGIYLFDTAEVQRTSDPALRGAVTSIDGFEEMYFRGKIAPSRYHRPYFLVFTDTATVAALRRVGLLHWVLWRFEQLTSSNSFVYLTLDNNADDRIEIEIQEKDAEAYDHRRAHLLVTTTKLVDECLDDPLDSWIMSLRENNPQPKISCLRVSLPQTDTVNSEPAVNARFLDFVRHMRRASRDQYCATHAGSWRAPGFEPRSLLFRVSRQLLGGGPVFPRVRTKDSPDIGFLVSVAEFGGVEKVAYSVAEIFKSHGWTPHLFVFGRQRCGLAHRLTKIFSTISFFNEPGIGDWNEHHRFLGSHYTNWGSGGAQQSGLGLLSGLDVVVNCHCADAHALMGQLRRLGTKTVAALHVTDLSFVARPTGHTYLVLGYEHAYDLITCCSRGLMNWCHMMGVPQEKLSLLWNAPSFIPDAAQVDKTMKAREARPHDRPLRVMFIGRFDRQKGLDRLALMVAAANEMRLPIEWRLIGAVIVDDEADGAVLENLGIRAEPSKGTAEELAECYAWADVIVLLSRWEGLPLTILEAMQFGVVVCATAVGSVPEAVEHGKTGFLLPTTTATIIIEGVQILQHLCEDASSLRRLSVAAAKAAQAWSWQQNTGEFLERIEKMLPKNNLLDLSRPRHP